MAKNPNGFARSLPGASSRVTFRGIEAHEVACFRLHRAVERRLVQPTIPATAGPLRFRALGGLSRSPKSRSPLPFPGFELGGSERVLCLPLLKNLPIPIYLPSRETADRRGGAVCEHLAGVADKPGRQADSTKKGSSSRFLSAEP
jgi:hypothetical protein